jgi:ABC-2 type transport system permease protein
MVQPEGASLMRQADPAKQANLAVLLQIEWLKLKRTPLQWLLLAGPIGFASLIVWYYAGRAVTPGLPALIFETFVQGASTIALPIGIGLLGGYMILQEELAGSFSGFLGTAIPRFRLYGSKLLLIIVLMASAMALSALALAAGLQWFTSVPIRWDVLAAAAGISIAASLPLAALHLWVSLAWGMGASAAIGGGGLLVAALSATSLGDAVWPYIPWAWPIRLSSMPGLYLLPELPNEAIMNELYSKALQGSVSVVVTFVVLWVCGLLWFRKWEGRKAQE